MNHMENLWGPDHFEFNPDRFSEEKVEKMPVYQFAPFSARPRYYKRSFCDLVCMSSHLVKLLSICHWEHFASWSCFNRYM